ncbi:3'-5' exonuclease family protein [Trichomonas vaginalis G3]|uniref:3'-5' exonuclease family protein n=1 Tax=Trichomonas vaginalis (strain ATCC PRA-98 / G3) TaxID=412133 RepID=A2F3M7_TRIV3|nr:3'-5' exonuclease protein [Trichomonas vaginalis G3]EAY00495.1 3'-5' exonuclease family protein [Trichomonas vaginalis G3]KAI5520547.1 3'-5' exonuclease protein [Trichomonas vaginalis G3]|eukprot:XP_001313424.1 3'-5' exonuclease family protein [Trichomonas vaginalis G3]
MLPRISFGPDSQQLDDLINVFWEEGETKLVDFFENTPVSVTVISSESDKLSECFNQFDDGNVICIDLEWKPNRNDQAHPISLFQFCSSKGVLIVPNSLEDGTDSLHNFLQAHTFYAKGISQDKKKLRQMFDETFDIIDIEKYYLTPNNLPLNFEQMITTLVGEPSAQFKDKKMTTSDWTKRPLSVKQILYAAFDVYGLFLAVKSLKMKYKSQKIVQPPKQKSKKDRKRKDKTEKVKKEPTPKSYRPVFTTDVAYRGSEIFDKSIIRKEKIYEPTKEFGPKQTMLNHYLATGEVTNNFCHICQKEFDDIKSHVWDFHGEIIPNLYFPCQTPSYLKRVIHEIILGLSVFKEVEENNWECQICHRKLNTIHIAFTHARLEHAKMIKQMPDMKLKDIVYSYYKMEKRIREENDHFYFDSTEFDNEEELKDYAWTNHGTILSSMWKHSPTCYNDEDIYSDEVMNLGIDCANKLKFGEVNHGILSCFDCGIGFDSPCELFVHLFHKHTQIFALQKEDIPEDYPLICYKIPGEFNRILMRFTLDNAIEELVNAMVLERKSENQYDLKCADCNVDMNDENSTWEHLSHHHLVCVFRKSKVMNFSSSDEENANE